MDKKGVQFSVIVPAFNAAKTIVRTVESVLGQSYTPFEVIVVDDCSSDGTVALLQKQFGQSIKILQNSKNSGSSITRNNGWDAATGDYVAFLDADDTWHTDKLWLLNKLIGGSATMPQVIFHPFTLQELSKMPLSGKEYLEEFGFHKLLPGNRVATSCLIACNRPDFRFEPTMRYTEDYDFALRYGYQYGIYMVNFPLTQIYRMFTTQGGISSNKWAMRKGEIRAYTRLAVRFPIFLPFLPLLIAGSLLKHVLKSLKD